MIYHITPWLTGNIGGGINDTVRLLPDDAWVCVRDGDTLFLDPAWGKHLEAVVDAHGGAYDLIGAVTNRIRAQYQLHGGVLSDEADMDVHLAIARQRRQQFGTEVAPVGYGPIAGFLMLFRKSTWLRHPFEERSIYFDQQFTEAIRRNGGKVGVALGVYIFHMYRWGQKNPTARLQHLAEVHR